MDIDTITQINAEERQYQQWLRDERNRILRMTNPVRKQIEWNRVHPKIALEELSEEELKDCDVW